MKQGNHKSPYRWCSETYHNGQGRPTHGLRRAACGGVGSAATRWVDTHIPSFSIRPSAGQEGGARHHLRRLPDECFAHTPSNPSVFPA
jgi:hypothetical protein